MYHGDTKAVLQSSADCICGRGRRGDMSTTNCVHFAYNVEPVSLLLTEL